MASPLAGCASTPLSLRPRSAPRRAPPSTGLYPHHHGVTANGLSIRDGVRGLPDYLTEVGYPCGYAGKWHADDQRGPSQLGYVGKDFIGYAFPGSKLLP